MNSRGYKIKERGRGSQPCASGKRQGVPALCFWTRTAAGVIESQPHLILGCNPQAGKPCNCPASRPKKKPRDRNRDISGLLDKGSYSAEAKGPGATPHHTQQAVRRTGWHLRLPFTGGGDVRLAHQLPGKPSGARPSQPLRLITIARANVPL